MENGWIKLHRKMTEWEWYKDISVFKVFLHLLLTANHEEKKWRGVSVLAGQKVTSYKHLSEDTGLGVQSVRTSIKKLKSTGELTIKTTNKYSIFTILNWNSYQKVTSNLTNEQQTTNKQLTTNKKYKNIRSKEYKKISGETPPLIGKKKEMRKNTFGSYKETSASDSFEEVIDLDTNEAERPVISNIAKNMRDLVTWVEERRGYKFISYGKEYRALGMMRRAKIQPAEIKERWIKLEKEDYYKKNGLDFMSVLTSFNKKR